MVRDGVANVVGRLRNCGFDPRKVGHDLWEARCPGHRGKDHALAISRNAHNQVVLECRGSENCHYARIIGALGFAHDLVYAETRDWLIRRLGSVQIQPSSFKGSGAEKAHADGKIAVEGQKGSATPAAPAGTSRSHGGRE